MVDVVVDVVYVQVVIEDVDEIVIEVIVFVVLNMLFEEVCDVFINSKNIFIGKVIVCCDY